MISMADAVKAFNEGNNAARGYAPYTDVPGPDTVEAAVEAAQADGWTVVFRATSDDEVTVLEDDDGVLLAIGNANGPWAVIISETSR
jgi:hypothetical protein